MLRQLFAEILRLLFVFFLVLEHARVGRRRGRWVAKDHVEHPLAALGRAGAIGVRSRRQHRAHPEHAAAMILRLERHALHLLRGHTVDAVELREIGIHEGVIARDQVENRAVLGAQIVAKRGHLLAHRALHVVVESREKLRARARFADFVRAQPAEKKAGGEPLRALVREQPLHLRFEHRGLRELIFLRRREQFLVWNGRPEKERKPRRQFDIAHLRRRDDGTRRRLLRRAILLDAEQKIRRHQHRLQRFAQRHPRRVSLRERGVIELHQPLRLRGRDGPPPREPRELRHEFPHRRAIRIFRHSVEKLRPHHFQLFLHWLALPIRLRIPHGIGLAEKPRQRQVRRREIFFEQRRRQIQRRRHVLETAPRRVLGDSDQRGKIQLDPRQIAHCMAVFRTAQPPRERWPRIGQRRMPAVEQCEDFLHPADHHLAVHRREFVIVRRHLLRPHRLDHALPELIFFEHRALAVELREIDPALVLLRVVALEAMLLQHRPQLLLKLAAHRCRPLFLLRQNAPPERERTEEDGKGNALKVAVH